MEIDFNGLQNKLSIHSKKTLYNVKKILSHGLLFNGPYTKNFLTKLSTFFPNRYILPTASGHDALVLALHSLRLKPGDEVIFPVNSYPTYFPVALSGAKPIPVDVTTDGLIDPEQISKKINKKTRAVIVTHLYGLIADIKKIRSVLKKSSAVLIEDCAQSFGSRLGSTHTGMFGDMAAFSLYPTKNLSTIGDGGFLILKHRSTLEWCKMTASYGEKNKYESAFPSFHSRLSEINASFSLEMLKGVEKIKKLNKIVNDYYISTLIKYNLEDNIYVLKGVDDSNIMRHLFVASVHKRDQLKKFLANKNIPTHVHYPTPVHKLPAFRSFFKLTSYSYPTAEMLSSSIISLPFHTNMSKKQIHFIARSIAEFYA